MAKLWQGRSSGEIDKIADDFNASIHFDKKMISAGPSHMPPCWQSKALLPLTRDKR